MSTLPSGLPQRGGTLRVLLFSETSGSLLDVGPTTLSVLDPGRAQEERVAVASGGARPTTRSTPFAVLAHRADVAEAMRLLRRAGCPLSAVALSWPSSRGGAHTAFYEACLPLGDSPGGPAPFGRLLGESIALESRRFHAATWVGPDLLGGVGGVPWAAEVAVAIVDYELRRDLPFVARDNASGSLVGTALDVAYREPGAVLPGPRGYAGPLWSTGAAVAIGAAGATSGLPISRLVVPLPAPGAELALTSTGNGFSENVGAKLSAYDRAGALVETGDDVLFARGEEATARITLPEEAWYVLCEVQGTLLAPPALTVEAAGLPLGVRRLSGIPCVSASVQAPDPLSAIPTLTLRVTDFGDNGDGSGYATLSWGRPTDAYTGYRLMRGTEPGVYDSSEDFGPEVQEIGYADLPLGSATYFAVRVLNGGLIGPLSNPVSVTPQAIQQPEAPALTLVSADAEPDGEQTVVLERGTLLDPVDGYRLYASADPAGPFAFLFEMESPEIGIVDQADPTSYVVRSYVNTPSGILESEDSDVVTATPAAAASTAYAYWRSNQLYVHDGTTETAVTNGTSPNAGSASGGVIAEADGFLWFGRNLTGDTFEVWKVPAAGPYVAEQVFDTAVSTSSGVGMHVDVRGALMLYQTIFVTRRRNYPALDGDAVVRSQTGFIPSCQVLGAPGEMYQTQGSFLWRRATTGGATLGSVGSLTSCNRAAYLPGTSEVAYHNNAQLLVHAADLSGSARVLVASAPGSVTSLAQGPDGRVYYRGEASGGVGTLRAVNVDGTGDEEVLSGLGDFFYAHVFEV